MDTKKSGGFRLKMRKTFDVTLIMTLIVFMMVALGLLLVNNNTVRELLEQRRHDSLMFKEELDQLNKRMDESWIDRKNLRKEINNLKEQ